MDTLNENAENEATEKPVNQPPADAAAKPTDAVVDQSAESDVEKEADEAKDPEVEELNEDGESVRQQTVQPVECENCHETYVPEKVEFVEVSGHQDIKDALVSGEYFLTECPHCQAKAIRPYTVTIVDSEKKYWLILAFNKDLVSAVHQARVSLIPKQLLEKGGEWKERVVLGPLQLDEKFRIFDAGLDDTCVEFAKVMLARRTGNVGIMSLHFHGIDHDVANFIVPGKREEEALFAVPLDVFKSAYQEGLDALDQFPRGMVRYVTAETVFSYINILEKTDSERIFHRVAEATGLLENEERGDRVKWHQCCHELAKMVLERIGAPEIKSLADVRNFFVGSFSISFGMGLGASTEWCSNPTGFAANAIFEMMIVPDGISKVLENAYERLGAFATIEIKDTIAKCIRVSLNEIINGMGARGYLVRVKDGGICVDPRLTEQVRIYLLMAVQSAIYQGLISGLSIQAGGVQETVQNGVKVRVSCSPFLNLAEAQNRIPLLRSVNIKNQTIAKLDNLVCTISSEENFVAEKKIKLRPLEMGKSTVLGSSDLILEPNLELLKGLQDAAKGSVTVTITQNDDVLFTNRYIIDALPANQAHDIWENPLLLAAFVKPNCASVRAFQSYIGAAIAGLVEDHSTALPIYQQGDPDDMKQFSRNACAAIYAALQKGTNDAPGTVYGYANPLSNVDGKCQQVRLPDEIFDKHQATCLDSSLLFASIMESLGLHPTVMIIQGHAFVGCHLLERSLPTPEYRDPQGLRRRISNGEFIVIETTALASGVKFAEAVESAEKKLADNYPSKFICAVDIAMARLNKIHPIYFDKEDAAAFDAIAQKNLYKGVGKLKELQRTIDVKSLQPRKRLEGRVEVWAQKLLNLSASNPMLNAKEQKSSGSMNKEVIYFPDCLNIGALEDWLAADEDVSIRSVVEALSQLDFARGFGSDREKEVIEAEANSHRIALPLDKGLWAACAEHNANSDRKVNPVDEQVKRVKKRVRDLYALCKKDVEEIGAQTLYAAIGFLKWSEISKTGEVGKEYYMAPILLVPITIERRLSDTGLCITRRDEDTVINTTLLELLKAKFGIDIPDLVGKDSTGTLPEDRSGVDVPYIIGVFKQCIGKGLEVVERAAIGRFSFGRYAMWRDLNDHLDVLEKSKPVSQLISGDAQTLDDGVEVFDKKEIDQHLDPEDLFCPVSADSSQLSAVLYSAQGKSFILQGPPGTGKSQTITNMVAHNLAKGRRVLFVAEKPGALDEVYRRLAKVGLAPFCLALHSTKCDKKQVMRQLNDSVQLLDKLSAKGTQMPEEWQEEIGKINDLRGELSKYVKRLHFLYPNELTAYDCFARSIKNGDARYADKVSVDCLTQTRKELEDQIKALEKLVSMSRLASPEIMKAFPALKPADWTPSYQEGLKRASEAMSLAAKSLMEKLVPIETALGIKTMTDSALLGQLLSYLTVLQEVRFRPQNFVEYVENHTPEELKTTLENVIHHEERRAELDAECEKANAKLADYDLEAVLKIDAKDVRSRIEEAAQAIFVMRSFKQKAIIKEFESIKKNGKLTLEELSSALDLAEACRAARKNREDFSDSEGMSIVQVDEVTINGIAPLQADWKIYTEKLAAFRPMVAESGELKDIAKTGELATRILEGMSGDKLRRYCKYRPARVEADECGLSAFADMLEDGTIKGGDLVRVYQDAYHAKMLRQIDNSESELSGFFGEEHEERIQQFKEAVDSYNDLTKKVIFHRLAQKYPNTKCLKGGDGQALRIIRQEIDKSRMPLRRFLSLTRCLVNKFKPCFLMSPDSVAQFLPMESGLFDIVIFDEASQIKVCDAVGAMARARQVVVVGDKKQMPPTAAGAGSNAALLDSQMDIKDAESILSDCSQSGFMDVYLNWHYRSRHETLIAFSNAHYYNGQLFSFPSVSDSDYLGVEYHYVEDAYYEGDSLNGKEADAIVDYVHKTMTSPEYLAKPKSIGIVTFAKKQGDDINAKLNRRCERDPVLSAVLSRWLDNPVGEGAKGKRGRKKKEEKKEEQNPQATASQNAEAKAANVKVADGEELFFIKNLEGVQGKEADIILYSICFAQNEDGKWPSNYGPIGHVGGGRRLNVAVTRAREKMIVFTSIENPSAMPIGKSSSPELQDFKAFLVYAKDPTGAGACTIKPKEDPGFVTAVGKFLSDNGFKVKKNVGLSGYKIDIGIVNPYAPKDYILGVECDGPSYSEQLTVRDRDVLRSSVLGMGGWTMCRVWSSEWQHTPDAARQRLLDKVNTIVARYEFAKIFKFLIGRKRLNDADMEYLTSEASAFDLHVMVPSIMMAKPTAEEEQEQPNPNLKFYYKEIQFKWNGKTYLLTNKFSSEGREEFLKWLAQREIDSDAFIKICRGEVFKFADEIAAEEEEAKKKAEEESAAAAAATAAAQPTPASTETVSPTDDDVDLGGKLDDDDDEETEQADAQPSTQASSTQASSIETGSRSTESVSSADSGFPVKIGKVAKGVFPVLFAEGRVNMADIEFLISVQAIKRFKTCGNAVLKLVMTDPETDAQDANGRNRFYTKFTLSFNGQRYILTSQWFANGLEPLLTWVEEHGITRDRVVQICNGGSVPTAVATPVVQQSSTPVTPVQPVVPDVHPTPVVVPPVVHTPSVTISPTAGFPYRVGQVAQKLFPVVFAEGRITDDDIAFLISDQATKFFKAAGNRVLKKIVISAEADAKDAAGRNRFYSKIILPYNGARYLVTSQWFAGGLDPLLSWLGDHGITLDRVKEVCATGAVAAPHVINVVVPPTVAPTGNALPQAASLANAAVTHVESVAPSAGAHSLDGVALAAMRSPTALLLDGNVVRAVTSWRDCFLALCDVLYGQNASKFDELPFNIAFRKYFKKSIPGVTVRGFCDDKLGSNANIMVVEVVGKDFFAKTPGVVKNLLQAFGIAASRITIQ